MDTYWDELGSPSRVDRSIRYWRVARDLPEDPRRQGLPRARRTRRTHFRRGRGRHAFQALPTGLRCLWVRDAENVRAWRLTFPKSPARRSGTAESALAAQGTCRRLLTFLHATGHRSMAPKALDCRRRRSSIPSNFSSRSPRTCTSALQCNTRSCASLGTARSRSACYRLLLRPSGGLFGKPHSCPSMPFLPLHVTLHRQRR